MYIVRHQPKFREAAHEGGSGTGTKINNKEAPSSKINIIKETGREFCSLTLIQIFVNPSIPMHAQPLYT